MQGYIYCLKVVTKLGYSEFGLFEFLVVTPKYFGPVCTFAGFDDDVLVISALDANERHING